MEKLKKTVIAFSLLIFSVQAQAQSSKVILESMIAAMGGMDQWKEIAQVTMNYAGHQFWLEQSENPDGPYLVSYSVTKEIHGVWDAMIYKKDSTRHFQVKSPSVSENMVNNGSGIMTFRGRSFPMPYQIKDPLMEWAGFAPEKVILKALNKSLDAAKLVDVDGTPHFMISFQEDELVRNLFINQNTRLLSKAEFETHKPNNIFYNPWGKFMTTVKYNLQWLHSGGIRYPAQWDVYKLDKPYQSITIFDISFQKEIDSEIFKIEERNNSSRDPVSADDIPLKTDGVIQIADNIFTIPGSWYLGHVVQDDGIVVIEGAITSGYSKQHIEYLRKTYPGKPIKAVMATSDAWPHIGGIREFAANGIPIYTHTLNQEIINDLLSSNRSINPDSFQINPQSANFNLVSSKRVLNDSKTPIEIYPINGEGGERMVALYFPKQKVLYASDLLQMTGREQKDFFAPQYLSEVKALVDRHGLDVEVVFAMHLSPIPWKNVTEELKKYK